jgi:hypothetical protein
MACFLNRHAACLPIILSSGATPIVIVGQLFDSVWPLNIEVEYRKGGIMNRLKTMLLGTFVAGSLIISGVPAHAQELGQDRRELKNDRGEIRDDKKELRQDRRELKKDLRQGASPGEIQNDRQELRNDRNELRRDQNELKQDRKEFQQDRRDLR